MHSMLSPTANSSHVLPATLAVVLARAYVCVSAPASASALLVSFHLASGPACGIIVDLRDTANA